ncbi:unnamed protein product [Adineta ricciae]|uniref:Uncharacterized protein n=3 Tax=Adineta ricciae TaxID=249248 RepID=A0A813T6Q0_ADIRI|nr:unnamed protein product [Adineta ricciae]
MCKTKQIPLELASYRIFISTKSTSTENLIDHTPSTVEKTSFNRNSMQSSNIASLAGIEQLTNLAFNHEQDRSSSSTIIRTNVEHHTFENRNQTVHSSLEQPLPSAASPVSQPIPDSIINGKQATNRISNERNSTPYSYISKRIILAPVYSPSNKTSELKPHHDEEKSINRTGQRYQIASLFTSTSTFLMHQNEVIAHATASDPFLSDTIFIIIIATLTILILLFCFGLFCLCRRTTKRNISPSFDGTAYSGLYGQSFVLPDDHYQQQANLPFEHDISSSSMLNERSLLPQTIALHHTAKQKAQQSQKKLKKKRVGFCCCNSNGTRSTTISGQTRVKRNY